MILFEEAYDIIMNQGPKPGTERVSLMESLGRILAEDIYSDIDMPPFDKAAMDGYACRLEDLHDELDVIETIVAGEVPAKTIRKGECSKIMTGAIVPEGADCVVMVEHTEEIKSNKIRHIKKDTRVNIAKRGEDIKSGDMVITKGTKIKPQHIAVLAATGYAKPLVIKKPRIGIISTGNELVEPEFKPQRSQIRNSNAYQLTAQVQEAGGIPKYYGIAEDNEIELLKIIENSISENDMILLTGGVSMGDFDIVPKMLRQAGFDLLFENIAVQPGKPTTFAVKEDKYCFGLPGNPVSSFMQFEMLVKPMIFKMSGSIYKPLIIKIAMAEEYTRKRSNRRSIIPVRIIDNKAFPVEYHGSAHISSLVHANGIVTIPIGRSVLKKGEIVDVRQI